MMTFGEGHRDQIADLEPNEDFIDASGSIVKIEQSLPPDQFKSDDLPEDLREYEARVLQQLEEYGDEAVPEDYYEEDPDQVVEHPSQQTDSMAKFKISLGHGIEKSGAHTDPYQD